MIDTSDNTPASTPAQRPTLFEQVFLGPLGLRAGWGLLLFLLFFYLGRTVVGFMIALFPQAERPINVHLIPLSSVLAVEPGLFLIVFIATWFMSMIEVRSLSDYGLDAFSKRLPQFLAGLFWGIVSLSLLVGLLWKFHLLTFDHRVLSGGEIVRNAVLWLIGFFFVGLLEDYFMRGYLQFTLARGFAALYHHAAQLFRVQAKPATTGALGFWTSAAVLSFFFGWGHHSNLGESPLGLVAAGLAGLIFCLVLWRTGSLWWAIGFHCSWDWAQSFLYGVPNSGGLAAGRLFDTTALGPPLLSGGTTGPEGSIFALPVLGIVAFIIVFTLPKRTNPVVEAEADYEQSAEESTA